MLKTTVTCRLLCTQFPPLRSLVSSSSFFLDFFSFLFSYFSFSRRWSCTPSKAEQARLVLSSSCSPLIAFYFKNVFLFLFFSLSNSSNVDEIEMRRKIRNSVMQTNGWDTDNKLLKIDKGRKWRYFQAWRHGVLISHANRFIHDEKRRIIIRPAAGTTLGLSADGSGWSR